LSREEWREFRNVKDLENAHQKQAVYTQAFVWRNKGFAYVSMFFTSPSGDWAHYVDYCFRSDETLARSESRLNTFLGYDRDINETVLISRIRIKHFKNSGPLIGTRSQVIDLKTKKVVPNVDFMDQDEPLFRQIKDFPFSRLLR